MKYEESSVSILKQEPGIIGMFKHIEAVARTAYKTQGLITDDSYKRFCNMLKERGHWACFEQGTVYLKVPIMSKQEVNKLLSTSPYTRYTEDDSFLYITTNYRIILQNNLENLLDKYWCEPYGDKFKIRITSNFVCSRSTSMEIIRHRAMCFLQESQRYVAYDKEKVGGEITFIIPQWVYSSRDKYINSTENVSARIIRANMLDSSSDVTLWKGLIDSGVTEVIERDNFWKRCEEEYMSSRKYLKAEDARGCLCNDTRTEIYMTGYLEDYIYKPKEDTTEKAGFFTLRVAPDAHPDFRILAERLKDLFIKNGYLI